LQLCIVADNPFGAGKLITNINLICDDYSNWDIVSVTFHKYKSERDTTSLIAMLDIWHSEEDECTTKNRISAYVFKACSEQFNNEMKNTPMAVVYPINDCSPVEKTAKRFRKCIS
jgi:hypothetical protein